MATYNNKHWLLSHVRNSFISTDDTGLCEAIMLTEDMPSQYAFARSASNNHTNGTHQLSARPPLTPTTPVAPIATNVDFVCYPGLDQSDDEDNYPEAQSYDIQMEHGGFILRSNTAQKLDKMKQASLRAAKIKNVKCLDPAPAPNAAAAIVAADAADLNTLFVRKEVVLNSAELPLAPAASRLAEQLHKHPRLPHNQFQQYARFDGTGQRSNLTKTIRIFLTMLPPAQRNYPLVLCVLETARIQEFIGLICYRATIEHPQLALHTVRNYALHITEEDGEVDPDFPPLDLQEPCAKFCFSHLSLVERRASEVRQVARTMSLSSEVEAIQDTLIEETALASAQQTEALRRMLGHTTKMEAPMYRSYQLQISRKGFFRTDIQLGISAEKLEIDPVQQQNSRFWSHQKAISHSMDAVVWCEIADEQSPQRAVVKIVYCPLVGGSAEMCGGGGGGMRGSGRMQMASMSDGTSPSVMSSGGQSSSIVGSGGGGGGNLNGLSSLPSNAYRSYKFLTDVVTAQEIVDKVRSILEVRSSPARCEYMQRFMSVSTASATASTSTSLSSSSEKRRKPFKKLFN